MSSSPGRGPAPPDARWTQLSSWLLTPRGQLAMAAALFGLSEMLAIPILVIVMIAMPLRDGQPAIQAAPELFFAGLAAVILIPVISSVVLYVKLRQSLARLRRSEDENRV